MVFASVAWNPSPVPRRHLATPAPRPDQPTHVTRMGGPYTPRLRGSRPIMTPHPEPLPDVRQVIDDTVKAVRSGDDARITHRFTHIADSLALYRLRHELNNDLNTATDSTT